jgi:hypothetical protein
MGVTVGVRATRQSQTVVNVSENCSNFQPSSERVNCDSAVGHPLPYLFTPGVTPWERGRPVFVASSRARCPRSQEKCERLPFTSTPSDNVCVFSRAAISVIAGRERAGMPAHPAGGDARAPGGRGRPRTRRAGTPAHPAGGDARAPGRNVVQSCGTSLQSEWATALPLSPLAPAPAASGGCRTCASDR